MELYEYVSEFRVIPDNIILCLKNFCNLSYLHATTKEDTRKLIILVIFYYNYYLF